MKVCCDNGKPLTTMSELDKLACNHDSCTGPIEEEDFDLLLIGIGAFDIKDCLSTEDLE